MSEALRQAKRAEQDLNSYQAKQGLGHKSDSSMLTQPEISSVNSVDTNFVLALESGVDEMVDKRFGQETGVRAGRGAVPTGSDNRPIPEEEGGTRDDRGR